MLRDRFTIVKALGCAIALAWAAPASAQIGLQDLIHRIGAENVPNGANVRVAQIEAPDGGSYAPNPALFPGKNFLLQSGASGNSGHAALVGHQFYGNSGVAPGITTIYCYEVNNWLQSGFLRLGQGAGVPPLPLLAGSGIKIMNHSWVGSGGAAVDNEVLRRADFVATRDNVLMLNGVQNGGAHVPLMNHGYNGIAVGRSDGSHSSGLVIAGIDGQGRRKPELVAPTGTTSASTGLVSSAAALLVETARRPPLASDPQAERAEVLKAALLAGAVKQPSWSNNPVTSGPTRGTTTQPLDSVFGAGEVNVNLSHMILTGERQPGTATVPTSANITHAGWDITSLGASGNRYWRIHISETAEKVSIVATWPRIVPANNMSTSTLANFDLFLLRVTDRGGTASLVGDSGLPYFTAGNVTSQSTVDNVEHLSISGLEPGDYVIHVRRLDGLGGTRDIAIAWLFPEPPDAPGVPGDLNGDGIVDVLDLLILLGAWGACDGAPCAGDINNDGNVDVQDLLILLGNWG